MLGARQSGRVSSLRMLQLLRDGDVIVAAREAAGRLVDDDPDLAAAPGAGHRRRVRARRRAAPYLEKA